MEVLDIKEQCEMVMIIGEERGTLRVLFEDIQPDENGHKIIPPHEFQIMSLRSRYNPDLDYYRVHCDDQIRYGMNADDIWDMIQTRYEESGHKPLNELFTFIERL